MTRTLLALALAALPFGAAPAAEPAPTPPTDITQVQSLDEVIVTGKLTTLSGIKKAMDLAEDRFYARYNELNHDDNLDIQCRVEAPTGTRIEHKSCDPKALDEATRAEAMRLVGVAQDADIRLTTKGDLRNALLPGMKQRTLQLLHEDPELLRALLEHARLSQMYDALRAKKFTGRFAVWD